MVEKRTAAERVLDVITGLDILYVAALLIVVIAWGIYTVSIWMLQAWQAGAWWRLALLSFTSLFLVGGTIRELRRRRVGAFSLVAGVISLFIGISQAVQ